MRIEIKLLSIILLLLKFITMSDYIVRELKPEILLGADHLITSKFEVLSKHLFTAIKLDQGSNFYYIPFFLFILKSNF